MTVTALITFNFLLKSLTGSLTLLSATGQSSLAAAASSVHTGLMTFEKWLKIEGAAKIRTLMG